MSIGIIIMGLFVGFLVGLTGVGGATLLTPVLMMFGIHPVTAVGTDLVYNSITKFFGMVQHWKQKTVNFKLVKTFCLGSIPGAIMAVLFLQLFQFSSFDYQTIVKFSLGLVLIIVAIVTLLHQFFERKLSSYLPTHEMKTSTTIIISLILGFMVGLTSVGSGSLFAMIMLYFYRVSSSKLVGTDIAHAFILVTVASFFHASMGNVDYGLVLNLIIGSIPGVIMGSILCKKIPNKPIRTVLGILLLLSGVKLI
jgi:uncharacterized membrane protein YfcA